MFQTRGMRFLEHLSSPFSISSKSNIRVFIENKGNDQECAKKRWENIHAVVR